MEHVVISLSAAERASLDYEVERSGHADLSAYISALAAADARLKAKARLEALLLEGLDSEPLEATPELFDEIRRKAGLIT